MTEGDVTARPKIKKVLLTPTILTTVSFVKRPQPFIGVGTSSGDNWERIFGPALDEKCAYCGHASYEHQGHFRTKKYKRMGIIDDELTAMHFLDCLTCAQIKQTEQVVCYLAPERVRELWGMQL